MGGGGDGGGDAQGKVLLLVVGGQAHVVRPQSHDGRGIVPSRNPAIANLGASGNVLIFCGNMYTVVERNCGPRQLKKRDTKCSLGSVPNSE